MIIIIIITLDEDIQTNKINLPNKTPKIHSHEIILIGLEKFDDDYTIILRSTPSR